MDTHRSLKTDLTYKIAILISLLAGIFFRIFHLFLRGFQVPFHLGGLFYQMSLEIIKNGFALPETIPYYYPGGLPFAYPPLPFYIQAALIKVFSPGTFVTVNVLPPLFSILSLLAFYLLARKVIDNEWGVVAAVFTFAAIPGAFTEQIEGAGLSESLGTLSLVLYTLALLWARDRNRKVNWLVPGLLLGVCVLSSPGSIYASILISLLFLGASIYQSFKMRNARFLIPCAIVAITGLVVSSPYWLTVSSYHGWGIFFASFSAQNKSIFVQTMQDILNLEVVPVSMFWNITFLLGLVFLSLLKKRDVLLIFFALILIPVPRENWFMAIPAALVIGNAIGIGLELLQPFQKIQAKVIKVATLGMMALASLYVANHSLRVLMVDTTSDISQVQIADLLAVKSSGLIPPSAMVITAGNWGLIEWSPALLERDVINNHFGLEWLPDRIGKIYNLSEKLVETRDADTLFKSFRKIYKDITDLYVIADQAYLEELVNTQAETRMDFTILQEFDELGLGLITIRN